MCEARVNDVITRQNLLLRPKVLKYIQSTQYCSKTAADRPQDDENMVSKFWSRNEGRKSKTLHHPCLSVRRLSVVVSNMS